MEKLLFMGVEPSTELALAYAKKQGFTRLSATSDLKIPIR